MNGALRDLKVHKNRFQKAGKIDKMIKATLFY